jgi:malonate transporter and related proteins
LYDSRALQVILDTVLPFFALIFCGYAAGRLRILEGPSIAGVNTFVFWFALPVFLFDLMATSPMAEVLNAPFAAAYLSAGLAVFVLAALSGRALFGLGTREAALMGAAAVLGNTGYMGLPLISAVFGDGAAIPMVVGLTLEVTVLIPLTIAVVEAGAGTGKGPLKMAKTVAGSLARNPLIVGIFCGALVSATSLDLPTPVLNFTDLLGGTAGPCALFVLGGTLAGFPVSSGLGAVSFASALKLLVHPAAMWFATTRIFEVDPLWAAVATLGAALPVAANVFILARQYDAYLERTASAILVSTTVSVLTVSALLTALVPA